LIDVKVGGETFPALVREVQRDMLRDALVHVDFYAVRMDQEIRAEVPVEFIGESPLVVSREALLVTGATVVEIECLPANLPASIIVDLSTLVAMDSTITASDLPLTEGVSLLTAEEEMIATLNYLADLEEEEEEGEEDMLYDAEAVEVISKGKEEDDEEF
jgi:large subunit ribosomal protein L25